MMVGPVIIVAGPTASGKSELGLKLAKRFGGVVVNADSLQVYRELRILTARPDAKSETEVSHRLYGVVPVAERFSVGQWLSMAQHEIDSIHSAGDVPIFVGGTGLYLDGLINGIADIPEVSAKVRSAATKLYEHIGGMAFKARLAERDPKTAARINSGDRQRLVRAWEVLEGTGRSISDWQKGNGIGGLSSPFLVLKIMPQRTKLYRQCDARFERMLADGVLNEVVAAESLNLDSSLPAMKALGMQALFSHLRGQASLEDTRQKVCQATRNYAKRQYTWFRNRLVADLEVGDPVSSEGEILETVARFLLTASNQTISVAPLPGTPNVGKS
ncbi:MAG: tRNA dimethylallyltransferase [Alphaproteobacteria bacterium MarineAlpha9_Bin7]|nr:MAG: tRNA dimethylallyltransferase [Alphaproteobacteria bacterium MarineAlpha9_Bin7]